MKSLILPAKLVAAVCFAAAVMVKAQEPLTLHQAIETALGQSPDARISGAGIREAAAGASLARTALLPQVNFTEDISRGDDPVYVFGSKLRQNQFAQSDFGLDALNQPQPLGNFATRLSGSWVAFDSFKTQKQIHSADLTKESAISSDKATNQKIVFTVIGAYQSVLYAERQQEIAQHEQETAEALFASVDDHVKAGLAVQSDRMSAQVNVASRKQRLIEAQGGLEIAWAQLRLAMGVPDLQETKLRPIEEHSFPQNVLEQELEVARQNRPDFASLNQAKDAQAAAVTSTKMGFGPRVTAYGNWEQDRSTFAGSGGGNWVAGVQIGIDLAPFSKRAQLAKENAMMQRADAQLAVCQQHIRLEVNQAHIERQTAQLSLETARAAIDQAAESLRILRNRYGAGLATVTDLLRAEDAERESQNNYWRAVYGNTMAYAQLLFATGTLTPEAAEELQ